MESGREDERAWPPAQSVEGLVTYVLLPAWIVPGVLDWYWHRRTRIEETAGARESAMHLLMQAEAGATVMAFLFLEPDAGVILAGLLGAVLHEATVMWDVAYTTPRRKLAPAEQHTHSFLEALPAVTAAALACMRPGQARALLGGGAERPRFAPRPRRKPLPAAYVTSFLLATTAFVILPHAEEFVRCWRAAPTLDKRPVPPLPPTTDAQRWTREHDAEGWEV
jgi:hypothetical protein